MRQMIGVFLLLALWLSTAIAPAASARQVTRAVDGEVVDSSHRPLTGVTVYLAHPTAGRSYPRFTDANGYFVFYDVPYATDPFYLELYWGRTLVYRAAVTVDGFVHVPAIILD